MRRYLIPRSLLWERSFKIALAGAWVGAAFLTSPASALDLMAWEASINPQTKERYIPVELWAASEQILDRVVTQKTVEAK